MTDEPPKPKKKRSEKQLANDAKLRERGKKWAAEMRASKPHSEPHSEANETEAKPKTEPSEAHSETHSKASESPHPSIPPPKADGEGKAPAEPPKRKPFRLLW